MKLAISNIGFTEAEDEEVYEILKKAGYEGLEIAPTRIIPDSPYEHLDAISHFQEQMKAQYGLSICSLQSIWYGRNEKLFASEKERELLMNYTKKAMDFAKAAGCSHLVFGSPKARCISDKKDEERAIAFFRDLGAYGLANGVVLGMEANPEIYGTNFINTTEQAIELIKRVASEGYLLNLDIGTMLYNHENLRVVEEGFEYIHHIHISEPNLKPIEYNSFHNELSALLKEKAYSGYVSIEMGKGLGIGQIEEIICKHKEVFG